MKSLPAGISFMKTSTVDNKLTSIVSKLIKGQELSSAEEKILLRSFNLEESDSANLQKIKDFIKLEGEDGLSIKVLDKNPFQAVDKLDGQLKIDNFSEELDALETRLNKAFGRSYTGSELQKKIASLKKALPILSPNLTKNKDIIDKFDSDIEAELQERLNGVNKPNRPNLDGLLNTDLGLLIRGASAGASYDVGGLDDLAQNKKDYQLDNDLNTGSGAEAWHDYLTDIGEFLPGTEKYKVEFLDRKLQNLEKLDPRKDKEALKDLLRLKDSAISDGMVSSYITGFNKMIDDTKAQYATNPSSFDFDPIMRAKMEAEKFANPSAPDSKIPKDLSLEDQQSFTRASNLLSGSYDLNEDNPDIILVKSKFTLPPSFDSMPKEEKKAYLGKLVDLTFTAVQAPAATKGEKDYRTADPDEFYSDFKKQVVYLNHFVLDPSRSDAQRTALKDDILRFVKSGTPPKELQELFEKHPEIKASLDYFKPGQGDPRMNIGFMKSILETSSGANGEKPVLEFARLVYDSNNMKELSEKLFQAVSLAGLEGHEVKIPVEFLSSTDKDTFHTFNQATFTSGMTKDKDGNLTPNGKVPILDSLGLNDYFGPEAKSFNPSAKAGEEGALPEKLLELLDLIYKDGAEEFLNRELVSEEDADSGDRRFANPLVVAKLLEKSIEKINQDYLDYESYKLSKDKATNSEKYSELVALRNNLIEKSKEQGLDIFKENTLMKAFHPREFEDALNGFAMGLEQMQGLMQVNDGFYKTPKGLALSDNDYDLKEDKDKPTSASSTSSPSRSIAVSMAPNYPVSGLRGRDSSNQVRDLLKQFDFDILGNDSDDYYTTLLGGDDTENDESISEDNAQNEDYFKNYKSISKDAFGRRIIGKAA